MRIEINQSGRSLVVMIWHPNNAPLNPNNRDHFVVSLKWIGPKYGWSGYVRAGAKDQSNYKRFGFWKHTIKEKDDHEKTS